MAQFNFPNSPSNGDTHTQNGVTYVWDGEAWRRQSSVTPGAQGAQGNNGAQGAQGNIGTAGSTGIPVGTIVAYGGSSAPSGWQLCNGGSASTSALQAVVGSNVPDLRDRFLVGSGSSYSLGATGGASSVTLTEAQMPQHSHGVTDPGHTHTWDRQDVVINNGYRPWPASNNDCSRTTANTGSNTTGISINNTGSSQSHENRPPYYALTYIIKT